MNAQTEKNTAATGRLVRKANGEDGNLKSIGVTSEGLVVVTVTVANAGSKISAGVTDDGDTVQVDIAGAPLQLNATV